MSQKTDDPFHSIREGDLEADIFRYAKSEKYWFAVRFKAHFIGKRDRACVGASFNESDVIPLSKLCESVAKWMESQPRAAP